MKNRHTKINQWSKTNSCKADCKGGHRGHAENVQKRREELLRQRKNLYKKYTNVDPKYKNYQKALAPLKKARDVKTKSPQRKRCCRDNKYVKEQIRAKLIKSHKTSKNNFFGEQNNPYENLQEFENLEKTIRSDQVNVQMGNTNLSNKLGNVIDLMQICLLDSTKKDPSEDQMVEEIEEPEVVPPKKEEKPQPVKAKRLTRPRKRTQKVEKESNLHKNTSGKVELEEKNDAPVVKRQTKKKVKVVTRTYEVPSLSYEYADLVSHMPSRVFNLHYPIEKADDNYTKEALI